MLDVSLTANNRFLVTLDKGHSGYEQSYILIRSLLTAYENKPGQFIVSFEDLIYLKTKINSLGLRETGKTISVEALDWLTHLQAEDQRLQEIKAGSDNARVAKLLEGKLKSTLFNDQLTGVAAAIALNRFGIWDTMGSGKTLEVIAAIVALGLKKVLIIAPLGVLPGAAREIAKHSYLKSITIPRGGTKSLGFLKKHKNGDWNILLVHSENLVGRKPVKFTPVLHMLAGMPWDLIAVDEFHKYKHVDKKRTQAVVKLINETKNSEGQAARALMLSGTPVSESPTNSYVFLKLCNYGRLPHIRRFERYFTITQDVKFGNKGTFPKIVGYKNLDLLKDMIERRSIRRTKNDLTGFPDAIYTIRDVLLSGKQADLYKGLKGQLRASLSKESRINLANILKSNAVAVRMRQVLNHPSFLDEAGDSAKYVEIDDILAELFTDPQAKVLIWTEYRKAVDLLYDRYNKLYGAIKVYGGVDITDKLINTFEAQDGPKVVVAIPAKGGEGLDFLARARTAVYVDRPYSFTLYSQSLDRIVRRVSPDKQKLTELDKIKQQPANIIFLDAVGTLDELVRAKLYEKQDMADALLTSDEKLLEIGRQDLLELLK